MSLVKNVAKFSGILYLFIGIPLVIEINNFLSLWLVEVPQYAAAFAIIMFVQGYISAISNSLSKIIIATGRVKTINIVSTAINLTSVVLFFSLLVFHIPIIMAMTILLIPTIVISCTSIFLIKNI